MFKSISGMQSNYRHDAPTSGGWLFSKIYRPSNAAGNSATALEELLKLLSGVSGGEKCGRIGYLVGNVNLPEVSKEMLCSPSCCLSPSPLVHYQSPF